MESKALTYLIIEDLVKAVDGIGKKTFLSRPKVTAKELTSFLVVSLTSRLYPAIAGNADVKLTTYGTISVFCKAKTDGTPNIGSQTDMVQSVMDLFPINGTHITAYKPTILMRGEDGYGYHETQIIFKIRTKFNARNN